MTIRWFKPKRYVPKCDRKYNYKQQTSFISTMTRVPDFRTGCVVYSCAAELPFRYSPRFHFTFFFWSISILSTSKNSAHFSNPRIPHTRPLAHAFSNIPTHLKPAYHALSNARGIQRITSLVAGRRATFKEVKEMVRSY